MANETSGHESEFINVQDLKAALQKFKTDKVDIKVDKVTDKGLSTNDFTTAEKTKLSNAVTGPASSTDVHVAVFDGATGKIVKDSGFTIAKSVPSNAVFTDTTYSSEAAASGGTAVSLCTTGEKYTWNNKLSASSFTNNNKGTSVEKIMVADASNGLGYSTPSDLASVMGMMRYGGGVFTATTSPNGNCFNDFDGNVIVFAAFCNLDDIVVIPYPSIRDMNSEGSARWWFHCMSSSSTHPVVANRSVTVYVLYRFML